MRKFLDSSFTQNFIIAVVVFNAIVLGLLCMPNFASWHGIFSLLDQICLYFFVVEMSFKLIVLRKEFWQSRWNIFDLSVTIISLLPFLFESVSIFRALRIFKVTRLLSAFPQLRFILAIISRSIPGMLSVFVLIVLIYYIYAVLGVGFFANIAPNYFGDLGAALFTLFQVMTGESWSEAVARPIMDKMPLAWIYFVSYIIVVSFIVLNMVIGIIVDSTAEIKNMQNSKNLGN